MTWDILFTTIENDLVSLKAGTLLSVTLIAMLLEVPALVAGGRHENWPLAEFTVAPAGPPIKLKVSVRLESLSVAEAVNDTVWPGLTVRFEIAASVGAKTITVNVFVAFNCGLTASKGFELVTTVVTKFVLGL